ncbi:MAG: RNA polymerase sigma factor [Planctomycetota bacterium]
MPDRIGCTVTCHLDKNALPEGIPNPKKPSSQHDARRPLSEAKLRQIMQIHGPRLLALARGVVRDTHLAEDIVQESFVKLWRQPPEAEAATASWLRTTVVRAAIDRIRKRQASPSESLNPTAPESPPVADAQEQARRIEQAMDRLDPEKRAVLLLRARDQLPYEAIAAALDIPVGTVMSRLARARKALLHELAQTENDAAVNPIPISRRTNP